MFENNALPTQYVYFNQKPASKKRYQHFISFLLLFFFWQLHSFIVSSENQLAVSAFRQWQVQATKSIAHGAKGPRLVKGGPPLHLDTGRLGHVSSSKGVKITSCCEGIILQGINISHLGKRKIIFKMPFLGDMLVSWRVSSWWLQPTLLEKNMLVKLNHLPR